MISEPIQKQPSEEGAPLDTSAEGTDERKEDLQVLVRGLPLDLSEEDLGSYMAAFDEVTKIVITKRRERSIGYSFVTFASKDGVNRAINWKFHKLQGQVLTLERVDTPEVVEKKKAEIQKRKVFVKGLYKKVVEKDLEDYFSSFGEVESVSLNKFFNGKSKRTAFIIFKEQQTVKKLLENTEIKHILKKREFKLYESLSKREIQEYSKTQKSSIGNEKLSNANCGEDLSFQQDNLLEQEIPSHKPKLPVNNENQVTLSCSSNNEQSTQNSTASTDFDNLNSQEANKSTSQLKKKQENLSNFEHQNLKRQRDLSSKSSSKVLSTPTLVGCSKAGQACFAKKSRGILVTPQLGKTQNSNLVVPQTDLHSMPSGKNQLKRKPEKLKVCPGCFLSFHPFSSFDCFGCQQNKSDRIANTCDPENLRFNRRPAKPWRRAMPS